MKDAVIEYEILNWEKFNPRTDAKSTSWCRLDSGMAASADCVRMEDKVFRVWVATLCHASTRRGKGRIALSHLSAVTRTSLSRAWDALRWIQGAEMIRCELKLPSGKDKETFANERNERNERNETNVVQQPAALLTPVKVETKKPKLKKSPDEYSPTYQVWLAYVEAYRTRYNREPDKNAKAMNQCKQLIDRVGFDNAKQLVGFYLTHNEQWYVKKCHMLTYCLGDAEALMTQMHANFQVTTNFARDQERVQTQQQMFNEIRDAWSNSVAAEEKKHDDPA